MKFGATAVEELTLSLVGKVLLLLYDQCWSALALNELLSSVL